MILATALVLVILHGPDGHEISINPMTVTSLREARSDDDTTKHTTKGVACIVNLTDGKFVTVREDCDSARDILQQ
ncbi:hypothetical protein ABID65_006720 [Bradyrhizobium sp. S3.9.2]|uniref:hypothetical protein n=1 Tax=Bradyrhizobium sp. S3.9.2 TaxID=3156432 RepID=UPI00339B28FA